MNQIDSRLQHVQLNQTARYERKWKDVFDSKNLLKYAKKIGKKWREVGTNLNKSEAELDTFEIDNFGLTNAIVSLLNSYKTSSPKYGTFAQIEELAEAFESADLMDLACDVRGNTPDLDQSAAPYSQQESMPPGYVGHSTNQGYDRNQPSTPFGTGQSGGHLSGVLPLDNMKEYGRLKNDHDGVYEMTARPRGVALIININKAKGFNPREGSAEDLLMMQKLFQELQFEVIVRQDLTAEEMKQELSNVSNPKDAQMKQKLKAANCVVVFLMSHGQRDEIFASDGRVVRCEEMFEMFQHKKSLDLVGKPVLFFLQACRGGLVDRGKIQADDVSPEDSCDIPEGTEQTDDYSGSFVSNIIAPETADFLIAYSSVPGYKSYRNTVKGSWFVCQVNEVFSRYAKEEHVVDLLTRVAKGVTESTPNPAGTSASLGFQPPSKRDDIYKQCSETVTRLRKKLYFFPGK